MKEDCCDVCEQPFTPSNPKYEHRVPRPSDKTDMCCVMATHKSCMEGGKTPEEWNKWIENEGAKEGYLFLT